MTFLKSAIAASGVMFSPPSAVSLASSQGLTALILFHMKASQSKTRSLMTGTLGSGTSDVSGPLLVESGTLAVQVSRALPLTHTLQSPMWPGAQDARQPRVV